MFHPELLFYLAVSAFMMTLLYVILKYFEKWGTHNLTGLTVNYLTASLLAFFYNYEKNIEAAGEITTFLPFAAITGFLFITVFYITALSAQRAGVSATSIAGKMSMVIPITAGILIFNDTVNAYRICGILLALFSVYFAGASKGTYNNKGSVKAMFLPFLLFIGSGIVDTSIKLGEHYVINEKNESLYISFLFGSAAVYGIIAIAVHKFRNGWSLKLKDVLPGIILGACNFLSLLFLLKCLSYGNAESSLIFAVVNMMVVIFSAIASLVIFKDPPGKKGMAGIALALLALWILSL